MKYRAWIAVLLFAYAAPSLAGGAGPMWIFPVGRLCVAQDSQHAETLLGRWILGGRLKLASPQFTQCARDRQWIPRHICIELMALDSEEALSRSNLERLGERWSAELKVLRVAGPYVADASEAEIAKRELPVCP